MLTDSSPFSTNTYPYPSLTSSTYPHKPVGAQVFKVDPAGHFLPYKAVATGKSEAEAMNFLEKKVDTMSSLDEDGAIDMGITTMQYVLSTDFKSSEIEVGVISKGNKFRRMTEAEVEARLTAISETSDV